MSTSDSFQSPGFTSMETQPIVLESLTAEVTSLVAELVILDEPAVFPTPGLNTGAQTQPVAQVPGNQTATPNVGGADPVTAHETTPNGFDPQVFHTYRWNFAEKEEPATVPNLAGVLPCSEYGQVHKIHDKMLNNAITAAYLHYGLRIPLCEGLSESDATKLKLWELKAYHRPQANNMQRIADIIEFQRHNIRQLTLNFHHSNREKPIEVLSPLHPIGFDIPNTVPGLEQLSVEQKRELLTACYYCWTEDDLDRVLMSRILVAFNLNHHCH